MKRSPVQRWLPGAWLLLAFAAAACTPWQPSAGEGTLTIVIPGSGFQTKAPSGTTAYSYEESIRQLQLLLFKGSTLYDYLSIDAASVSFPYTRQYPSLGAGIYRIYAVANGPDLHAVTTESALLETDIHLKDCGLTDATGFVMMGDGGGEIASGATSRVDLFLQRYASRVRVTSIRNRLPADYADGGAMVIKGIFLINALQDWNLGAVGAPSGWLNLGGREAGKAASTNREDYLCRADQVPAAFRPYLYRNISVPLSRNQEYVPDAACFYSFPNGVETDHPGPEATEQTGAPARLVVLAGVNGADWWYPVTLRKEGNGLERNKTYDVALTIRATGSADPNEPVTEASLAATVTCTAWSVGSSYTEPL